MCVNAAPENVGLWMHIARNRAGISKDLPKMREKTTLNFDACTEGS
jgi:hypothetical protein